MSRVVFRSLLILRGLLVVVAGCSLAVVDDSVVVVVTETRTRAGFTRLLQSKPISAAVANLNGASSAFPI